MVTKEQLFRLLNQATLEYDSIIDTKSSITRCGLAGRASLLMARLKTRQSELQGMFEDVRTQQPELYKEWLESYSGVEVKLSSNVSLDDGDCG